MPVTTPNVSTVYATEWTRDEIITRAYQIAGLLNEAGTPTPAQKQLGADLLGMELDALQAEGIVLRTVDIATLSLVAAQATYALPADTLDVVGTANVVRSGVDTPVQPMTREEWMLLSNKNSQAIPTRYYLHRQATVTIYLWPVPAAETPMPTLRYQKVRLLKDTDTGARTLDLEKYWIKAILWRVAYEVATAASLPSDRMMLLKAEADGLRARAKAYNRPHGPSQVYFAHRTPRWRS